MAAAGSEPLGGGPPGGDLTDKYNKLKEKYNKLKDVARIEVKAEKEQNERSEKQLKEKEATIRQQLEEIDSLKFQNGRLSKQQGALNAQLEELQKQNTQKGGFMQGVFSGKQQQEAIQKAEEEKQVLRDELMMKINENEELHMQIFEVQRQAEEEASRLQKLGAQSAIDLQARDSDLEAVRGQTARLIAEANEMSERIAEVGGKLKSSAALAEGLQRTLNEERHVADGRVKSLQAQFARWVPFDESEHDRWNLLNVAPWRGRVVQRHGQVLQQLQAGAVEACRHSCAILQAWPRLFPTRSANELSPRLLVRNRMTDTVQRLAKELERVVQEVTSCLCVGRHVQTQARLSSQSRPAFDISSSPLPGSSPLPALAWSRQRGVANNVRAMLKLHRQWVASQSMLLLHDGGDPSRSRSVQDEVQAQRFVDCLWRLHRCVRLLFSRLQMLACIPALSTRDDSLSHFALARRALRRGVGSGSFGGSGGGSGGSGSSKHAHGAAGESIAQAVAGGATERAQASRMLEQTKAALEELCQCWEGVGRCLSSWAAGQSGVGGASTEAVGKGEDGGKSAVELLEGIKRFCACLSDHIIPVVSETLLAPKSAVVAASIAAPPVHGCSSAGTSNAGPRRDASVNNFASIAGASYSSGAGVGASASATTDAAIEAAAWQNYYLSRSAVRLHQAPPSVGFHESVQTRLLCRRLALDRQQLSAELRQQVNRFKAVTDEKQQLTDGLRALQDEHALLRSNFLCVQERHEAETAARAMAPTPSSGAGRPAVVEGVGNGSGGDGVASSSATAGSAAGVSDRHSPVELILNSRQRALLDSVSVTAQENASLRQHGFFVDMISLSPTEVELASGPPGSPETAESWELAVRKVYEQHSRNLLAQVRAADGKAMELHLSVQQKVDTLREQEEAKQKLRDQVGIKQASLDGVLEDMATTRKNYDTQLAMLTEHICTLSVRLSDKDNNLAGMQSKKILCGHCGMWNTLGKLLSTEAGGACPTCKERVVGRG